MWLEFYDLPRPSLPLSASVLANEGDCRHACLRSLVCIHYEYESLKNVVKTVLNANLSLYDDAKHIVLKNKSILPNRLGVCEFKIE